MLEENPLFLLEFFSDPRKSSIMPLVSSKVKTDDEFQLNKAEHAIQPEDEKYDLQFRHGMLT